jgi:hypothetical protein
MSLILRCEIQIGKAKFKAVSDLTITKSIYSIAQTCVIKLPISAVLKNTDGLSTPVIIADYIKKGDEVNVTLWYDSFEKKQEFFGFVKMINRKQPLEIECENAVFLLRGKTFKKSFKTVTLKQLLTFITEGTGITLHPSIEKEEYKLEIKNFQIPDKDGIWVLEQLRELYMQTVYFTGDKELYVGLAYTNQTATVKYAIGKNIINTNDLKWQDSEDVKIKVRCVYWDKKGKHHEVSFGDDKVIKELADSDVQVRTIHLHDIKDEAQLKQIAQAEAEKYKYSGYRGKFDAFLVPYCEPMMVADIQNKQYPERAGRYFVSGIVITYGTGGGRRKPEIDIKLS